MLKWACVLAVFLIIGGATTGWLLFQHIPTWYTPTRVPAAELQAVKNDLESSEASFSHHMQADDVFEFRITQDQLNAWLAAREQFGSLAKEWVPPMMEYPFIAFEPGRIVLAGTVVIGSVRTVLSASMQLAVDGQGLSIRLTHVNGGSLPVPDSLVREQLRQLDARRPRGKRAAADLPPAESLLAGTHVPPEFVWWNGNRPFRIRSIQVEHGAITFRVEPLPRHYHGRE